MENGFYYFFSFSLSLFFCHECFMAAKTEFVVSTVQVWCRKLQYLLCNLMAWIIIKIFCFPPFLSFSSRKKKLVYATFWPQNNNNEKALLPGLLLHPHTKDAVTGESQFSSCTCVPALIGNYLLQGRKQSPREEQSGLRVRGRKGTEIRSHMVLYPFWIQKSCYAGLKNDGT